ncbi:MAG: BadF/BadG/BcrA/BcrD ATPase family protein [Rhodothermia bacterium]|nr:MAG: BadF/BadG/BcrA/BcrD ATPase family protein [Rhodothermia bacterium]
MTESQSILCVGIDVGGTKTSIAYRNRGAETDSTVRFSSHGYNYHRAGTAHIIGLVAASLFRIREETQGETIIYAVAGIAGAGRKDILDELNQGFATVRTNPLDRFEAHSDAHIAVEGAFSGRAGAIVIAGTGSGVYAKSESGNRLRAGGWGARLGDPGSGEQVGRRALSAVSRAWDGGKRTRMSEVLATELDLSDRDRIIRAVYDENLELSTLAPFVLEAAAKGDEVAHEILQTEAYELANEARLVLEQLDTPRVALMGGLIQNTVYRHLLEDAVTAAIPGVEFTVPDDLPEIGALRLAEELSDSEN